MLRKLLVMSMLPAFFAGPVYADRDIAVADLPGTVTASIMKVYPHAKIIKAEEEHSEGVKYYEVKIQDGDSYREIHIRPGGTILKSEIKD